MKGMSEIVGAALLILIVFILAIILGSWAGYTNSKILADSYNNYINQTKGVIASIFGFFHQ
jgi:flagellin-like protein